MRYKKYHRGSSLVYLGLSLVLFCLTYGLAFTLMPQVLGAVFGVFASNSLTLDASWLAIYNQNVTTIKFLVPLMPAFGIVFIVIKVLMVASARGSD